MQQLTQTQLRELERRREAITHARTMAEFDRLAKECGVTSEELYNTHKKFFNARYPFH